MKHGLFNILSIGILTSFCSPCYGQLVLDPSYNLTYGFLSETVNAMEGLGSHSGTGSQYQNVPGSYYISADQDETYGATGQSIAATASVTGSESFTSDANEISTSGQVSLSSSVVTVDDGADANSEFRENFAFTATQAFTLNASLIANDPNAFLAVTNYNSSSNSINLTGTEGVSDQILPAGYYSVIVQDSQDTSGAAIDGNNDLSNEAPIYYGLDITSVPEPSTNSFTLLSAAALMVILTVKRSRAPRLTTG